MIDVIAIFFKKGSQTLFDHTSFIEKSICFEGKNLERDAKMPKNNHGSQKNKTHKLVFHMPKSSRIFYYQMLKSTANDYKKYVDGFLFLQIESYFINNKH